MILFCNVKLVVAEFLAQFISAQISCPTHFIGPPSYEAADPQCVSHHLVEKWQLMLF
jgi:hypothetical protein